MEITVKDILNLIESIRRACPELRFGQIISNAITGDLYYKTNKGIYTNLKTFYADHLREGKNE